MKRKTFIKTSLALLPGIILNKYVMASNKTAISMRLLRHATIILKIADTTLLIDPLLSKQYALDPVRWSNETRNPTVELPISENELQQVIDNIDAVLLTHTHQDHWDIGAQQLISKQQLIICQPEDEAKLNQQGFTNLDKKEATQLGNMQFERVAAQHGHGELIEKMAPASGFIVKTNGKTIYIAGDTVWCDVTAENIAKYQPDYIIVNAGGAQFNFGEPITMTAEDVIQVAKYSKASAKIIVVHMEAINHCRLTRKELKSVIRENNFDSKISVPENGEHIFL